MDTWSDDVDQLARQFHDSVANVLTGVVADCQRRNIQFNEEFIDSFYGLLDEKWAIFTQNDADNCFAHSDCFQLR